MVSVVLVAVRTLVAATIVPDTVKGSNVILAVSILCWSVLSIHPVAAVLLGCICFMWLYCWMVAMSPVGGMHWLWSHIERSPETQES
jgi:hypothetical protein